MFEHRKKKGSENPTERTCVGCGLIKPAMDFFLNREGYLNGRCKPCCLIRQREYRSTRKKTYANYAKLQREKDPERFKQTQKRYASKNPDRIRDANKRSDEKRVALGHGPMVCVKCNQEKDRIDDFYLCEQPCRKCRHDRAKIYRQTPEGKARRKAEYEKDKESAKARAREYQRLHPEKVKIWRQRAAKTEKGINTAREKNWRRREKMLCARVDSVPLVTAEWFASICDAQNHRCAYCLEHKVLTMDHVTPLARGGKHIRGNIVGSCKSCNSRKSDRLPSEWKPEYAIEDYGLELASA